MLAMSRVWGLTVSLLLLACSVGSTPDVTPPPTFDAKTSRAAAARALDTLKSSIRPENAKAFGFQDPKDAQDATLVEVALANKRLDVRKLVSPSPEAALVEQAALETWAYQGPHGAVGQILVRKAPGGAWAPMAVGSTRAMGAILATMARIKEVGGTPKAIVRTYALPKTFLQYELNGKAHLIEARQNPELSDKTMADSLREIAMTLDNERREPVPRE